MKDRKQTWQAALVIGVLTLVNHGLILFNNGVYWDDWINYLALLDHDWDKLFFVYYTTGGIPLTAYLHWAFSYSPDLLLTYRIVAFLCIGLSAFLFYWISKNKLNLPHYVSLLSAVLALSYPAYQMSATIVGTSLWVYYVFFLIGACCYFLSLDCQRSRPVFLRATALVFLFLSYRYEALLVLSYAIVLIELYSQVRAGQRLRELPYFRFALERLDLLLLPFAYWFVSRAFFPAPIESSYNQFFPGVLISTLIGYLNNLVIQQFARIWSLLVILWPVALVMLLLAISAVVYFRRVEEKKRRPFSATGSPAISILLLVMTALPFSLVGKDASVIGYGTRHALLLGWPVGLLITAGLFWLSQRFPKTKRVLAVGIIFLLGSFVLTNNVTYLTWQARWAKDESVMQKLAGGSDAADYSVYLVEDHFGIQGLEKYRFYEWAGIFNQVWGGETRVGIQLGFYSPESVSAVDPVYLEHFNTSQTNLHGCYAKLSIGQGLEQSSPEIGLRYLFYRLLQNHKLGSYLEALTFVEVTPIDSEYETDCFE